MNARQNFTDALNHRQPKMIPVDFGATAVTGIHAMCVANLREYYGLDKHPVTISEPYQMLGLVEDDLAQAIGVTVTSVIPPYNLFGFSNLPPYKPYRTLWGQEVLVPHDFNTVRQIDGSEVIFPGGDITVPPSGRMPTSGFFFDSLPRQRPFTEADLDYHDNLEEFGQLDSVTLDHFRCEAQRLAGLEMGAICGLPGTALGDIALVPGPQLKNPRGIRDVAEWYISTIARPDYVHHVFEAQVEIALKNLSLLRDTLADTVQAVMVCGTDFGTQNSQFCSPVTFDNLYLPYYRQINEWIHANTGWKTFKHSCGAIAPLLPNIINAGFDIINPVQCSAAGMEPTLLKKRFGDRLVFWGGGVDTQWTLPFGTPEQVRTEVLNRCDIFGRDGGFVFNTVHNIQAMTPVKNIVAMIDALHEINR
jgi:hypothetical protein